MSFVVLKRFVFRKATFVMSVMVLSLMAYYVTWPSDRTSKWVINSALVSRFMPGGASSPLRVECENSTRKPRQPPQQPQRQQQQQTKNQNVSSIDDSKWPSLSTTKQPKLQQQQPPQKQITQPQQLPQQPVADKKPPPPPTQPPPRKPPTKPPPPPTKPPTKPPPQPTQPPPTKPPTKPPPQPTQPPPTKPPTKPPPPPTKPPTKPPPPPTKPPTKPPPPPTQPPPTKPPTKPPPPPTKPPTKPPTLPPRKPTTPPRKPPTPPPPSQTDTSNKEGCLFPKQDPFDPEVMKRFSKKPDINCTTPGTIPSIVYREKNYLHINKTKAQERKVAYDYCYYITITRLAENSVTRSVPSKTFTESITFDAKQDNIVATCEKDKKVVAVSYFTIVLVKDETEKRCSEDYKRHVEMDKPAETLSVLMIGIDGTSSQNFARAMPKTRKFIVDEMKGMELQKFNKIGDNTFPNVVPLMSGISQSELYAQPWHNKEPFDKVDPLFLWSQYRKAGYRTGMVLDHTWITAFHYLKKGWTNPPFDYYHRNMVVEMYKRNGQDKWSSSKNGYCAADVPYTSFLLDYSLQLCSTFNNTKTQPYFSYSFIVQLTHDDPNMATLADKLYLEFFQELSRKKVLNNTVLVWFSDHGARFGPIRSTEAGIWESKTPFMFFIFPEWFKAKYPEVMATFRTNQHRLTTHYDVHATLKDLLNFKGVPRPKATLSTRGISLFQEIPTERDCSHAGVPIEFCMCTKFSPVPITPEVKKRLTGALIKHIADQTSGKRDLCHALRVDEIKAILPTSGGGAACKTCRFYLVTLQVTPGRGVFEATVQDDEMAGGVGTSVMGTVVRLNMYKGTAECVDEPALRPFCFCKAKP